MLSKSEARKIAHVKIKATDWFLYVNPVEGLRVSIQGDLIEPFANASGLDALDAVAGLARSAARNVSRLESAGIELGQSEEILQTPLKETYHVCLLDGQCYISNRPFYPYPK